MLGIFQGQKEAGTEETEWEMGRVGGKQMPSRGTSSSDEMAATFPLVSTISCKPGASLAEVQFGFIFLSLGRSKI